MDSGTLSKLLATNKVTAASFIGVFPSDKVALLERGKRLPESYIANCSPSGHGGTHWVAFYQEEQKMLEVFDSYGKPLGLYNKDLLASTDGLTIIQQSQQLQQIGSTVCGQYCMFFILKRAMGMSYKHLIHLFTDDIETNDKMVCQFVNSYFDIKTPVYDNKFLSYWSSSLSLSALVSIESFTSTTFKSLTAICFTSPQSAFSLSNQNCFRSYFSTFIKLVLSPHG
jgi:hypothetical protein